MLQVQIREIRLKLPGEDRIILNDATFDLPGNSINTILGKNGSGKSTLIKAITGLLDKNIYSIEGNVISRDKNIFTFEDAGLLEFRKNKVKYVFQDAINSFDPLRKLKYYFDFMACDKNLIDETLEYFLLPLSDELFKMHSYEVSGGMAQRISFALALLAQPEIIILDEPTSGIDSAIANLFLLKLKEFSNLRENSVLLVTQDILFAEKVSDKIAYLKEGKLSDFYSPETFFMMRENPLLADLLSASSRLNDE